MACPASANLDLAIPNWTPPVVDPTAGAKGKGSAFHAMLEPIMALTPAEVKQFAIGLAYVAEVRARRRFQVLVEETATADWLTSPTQTTADLVLHTKDELHILDWKWGKIPVEVFDNQQLLFYAATYAYLAPKAKEVHLHIVQPPADNCEEWVVSTTELLAFMNKARLSEKLVLAGDTTFGPSDSCLFCPAYPHSRGDKGKPLCPATMALLYPPIIDEQELLDGI